MPGHARQVRSSRRVTQPAQVPCSLPRPHRRRGQRGPRRVGRRSIGPRARPPRSCPHGSGRFVGRNVGHQSSKRARSRSPTALLRVSQEPVQEPNPRLMMTRPARTVRPVWSCAAVWHLRRANARQRSACVITSQRVSARSRAVGGRETAEPRASAATRTSAAGVLGRCMPRLVGLLGRSHVLWSAGCRRSGRAGGVVGTSP